MGHQAADLLASLTPGPNLAVITLDTTVPGLRAFTVHGHEAYGAMLEMNQEGRGQNICSSGCVRARAVDRPYA